MKFIPLTQGKFAMVDDVWFDYLNQWKWCYHKSRGDNGYAERGQWKDGKLDHIKMHRVVMGCKPYDGKEVDHRDDDGLNNQQYNLRVATDIQNSQNRRRQPNNTSGYKGVHFQKSNQKWVAYIGVNKKRIYLGLFTSKVKAARAYDAKALECFGEFAQLNFPIVPPMR